METQVLPLDRVIRDCEVPVKRIAAACDVGQDTLLRWRRGQNAIPSDKLLILSRVLDTPVCDLMGWTVEP